MSEIFLIREELNGGRNVVRGVSAEGQYWLCAIDVFGLAIETIKPKGLSIPVRPPLALVANSIKSDPSAIARSFKSFGLNRNDFSSSSAGYLSEVAWSSFLTLSGVPDEQAADFIEHMYHRFHEAKEAYRSISVDRKSDEPSDSMPEAEALRNRVKSLEDKNSSLESRVKKLEYEHSRLLTMVKREFAALSERGDAASETSKELKAYASRLYARSKQLEEQGR